MKLRIPAVTVLFWAICLFFSHRIDVAAAVTAVLVHELTHLIVLWSCGGRALSLTITPLGLTIERSGLLSHAGECILSLSAPLFNLLLALFYYRLGLADAAVAANLGYGLLNLLPILPLDGGKALSSLCALFLPAPMVNALIRTVSSITLLLFWVFSIAIALLPDSDLSLLIFSVGLFCMWQSAKDSERIIS